MLKSCDAIVPAIIAVGLAGQHGYMYGSTGKFMEYELFKTGINATEPAKSYKAGKT